MTDRDESIDRWIHAGETLDVAEAVSVLGDDVRLISPITDRFAFIGRERVATLLTVAFEAVESIRYTDRIVGTDTAALFYEGRVDGVEIGEAQRLRFDDTGRITEITLFVRPLPGLTRLMRRLGPELARRTGKPGLSRMIRLPGAMLDGMAATGERRIMPKADPDR